jgi:midasin
VWSWGVLARAVREGHWLLLEDVDAAPKDVLSLLLPLLETNTLAVPGHTQLLHAHPAFRLFATHRSVTISACNTAMCKAPSRRFIRP